MTNTHYIRHDINTHTFITLFKKHTSQLLGPGHTSCVYFSSMCAWWSCYILLMCCPHRQRSWYNPAFVSLSFPFIISINNKIFLVILLDIWFVLNFNRNVCSTALINNNNFKKEHPAIPLHLTRFILSCLHQNYSEMLLVWCQFDCHQLFLCLF